MECVCDVKYGKLLTLHAYDAHCAFLEYVHYQIGVFIYEYGL